MANLLAGDITNRTYRLRRQLMHEEDIRLCVYDDATGLPIEPGTLVKGHPTIGYGRALDVNGITVDESSVLLDRDIREVFAGLRLRFDWFDTLDPVRQVALADLAFTTGGAGVEKFRLMIAAIKRHDWPGAADQVLASKWARDVGFTRSNRLAHMLRTGEWPKDIPYDDHDSAA